jgi:hypothetical protein
LDSWDRRWGIAKEGPCAFQSPFFQHKILASRRQLASSGL